MEKLEYEHSKKVLCFNCTSEMKYKKSILNFLCGILEVWTCPLCNSARIENKEQLSN